MTTVTDLRPPKLHQAYLVDWQRLILDLRAAKLSSEAIARQVGGCSTSTIKQLVSGRAKDCRFSVGAALLDLHKRMCDDRHDLPALMKRATQFRKAA